MLWLPEMTASVENAIRANIDALGTKQPAVKLLLELCSVLGGEYKMAAMQPLWQLADGGSDAELQQALMVATKKKLLTSMSSKGYAPAGRNRKSSVGETMQFQFVHLRILDVCLSSVLKARSNELHQHCSEFLSADAKNVKPEVLAWHLGEAEQHERALGYWRMALDNCERASGDVQPFATACLATLDRLELEGPRQNKVMIQDGMEYNSDDGVVPKGYLWDEGCMTMFGLGDHGQLQVPFVSGFLWATKLNALMVGAHTLSADELAVLRLPSPERLLPDYTDDKTWLDDEGCNIMAEFTCARDLSSARSLRRRARSLRACHFALEQHFVEEDQRVAARAHPRGAAARGGQRRAVVRDRGAVRENGGFRRRVGHAAAGGLRAEGHARAGTRCRA